MASSLDQAAAGNLLAAMGISTTSFVAYTGPAKVRLCTVQGSASTNGTEVVNAGGSSYAAKNFGGGAVTVGTPSTVSNASQVDFTNMPALASPGVQAAELIDSSGTPKRLSQGALTASKTTNLGDTLSFGIGTIVQQMQ